MTQEEKDLLLKDLCARLPYGVKAWYKYFPPINGITSKFVTSIKIADNEVALSHKFNKEGYYEPIEEGGEIIIKPYLRPMSSMTREERKEYDSLFKLHEDGNVYCENWEYFDWMNKHHFDCRGLISKGLAIEVTESNNPYEN